MSVSDPDKDVKTESICWTSCSVTIPVFGTVDTQIPAACADRANRQRAERVEIVFISIFLYRIVNDTQDFAKLVKIMIQN